MPASIDVVRDLYAAMARFDVDGLRALLADDFVGTVSAGMPHGVGGEHHGADEMIADVWGRIATLYDMRVEPAEFLATSDDRVVVLGTYRGRAHDGDAVVDAVFAHVIDVRASRITALRQITDTARWGVSAR
jgi:uncharacterized protein